MHEIATIAPTAHLTDETAERLLRAVYGIWRNNGHDVPAALEVVAARHMDSLVRVVAGDEYLRLTNVEGTEAAYTLALGVMVEAEHRACPERG